MHRIFADLLIGSVRQQDMPPRIVTYFTYSELAGTPPTTIEEFRAELTKFGRAPVIYACCVINAVLRDWDGHFNHDAHDALVRTSFPPEIANVVIAALHNPSRPRGLFHRQQLLFVGKEAIMVCGDSGGRDPAALPYGGGLGMVLLMANDLLRKDLANSSPTTHQMINVLYEFIPFHSYKISPHQQPNFKRLSARRTMAPMTSRASRISPSSGMASCSS